MSKKDDKPVANVIRVTYLKKDGRSFWRGGVEHQGVKYYDPAFFTKGQLAAIRAEADENALALLTAEQKETFESMKGEKIELPSRRGAG